MSSLFLGLRGQAGRVLGVTVTGLWPSPVFASKFPFSPLQYPFPSLRSPSFRFQSQFSSFWSAQKAPAGCFSTSKYNFIRPKGPCGTTFCYSQREIDDIGTEILYKTCFGHNSTQNERISTIFGRIFTEFYVDSESGIKTRF